MAFENKLAAVSPQAFTADGTSLGVVTIGSTCGFYIKQFVILQSNSIHQAQFQVKNILSDTQLILGPNNNSLSSSPKNHSDISAYTVSQAATISAPEQNNFPIPADDHYNTVFMPAPVMSDRVINIDCYGNPFDADNPLPVTIDGTISISTVEIKGSPSGDLLNVNADGSINVVIESSPSPTSTVVSTYEMVSAVPSNSTSTIVSYTIPIGKQAVLQRCPVSGDNIGRYTLSINGTPQDTLRTMFGGDLTQMFDFTSGNDSGLVLDAGDQIAIEVFNPRPYPADFNGRIQVLIFT